MTVTVELTMEEALALFCADQIENRYWGKEVGLPAPSKEEFARIAALPEEDKKAAKTLIEAKCKISAAMAEAKAAA